MPVDAIVTRVTHTDTALILEALIGTGIDERARGGLRDFRLELIVAYPELPAPIGVIVPVKETKKVADVGHRTTAVSTAIPVTKLPASHVTAAIRVLERAPDGDIVIITDRTHTTISCAGGSVGLPKPTIQ